MNTKPDAYWPMITVWVAARNEEHNIAQCLSALNDQDYPKDKIQILVGNDQSFDKTRDIVLDFSNKHTNIQCIDIESIINNQRGKANVLAHLYKNSTGHYFLITDADVIVPKTWAKGMVNYFLSNKKLGHLIGISSIKSKNLFGILQSLDWLWALTLLKIAQVLKIPLTGLGNNSALSRKAYEATGGYAKVPFSITEDFALFHEVVLKNFAFHNAFSPFVYAKTKPMDSLKEFLHQRKRWMVGALQCPAWVLIFLYAQALFLVLIIGLLIFSPKLAIYILIIKYLITFAILAIPIYKLKEYKYLPFLILYEPYAWLWTFAMLIFYYLPINIDWKGRIYTTHD